MLTNKVLYLTININFYHGGQSYETLLIAMVIINILFGIAKKLR